MNKEKITIYTNKTCPYCKLVKEELEKNNIEFEEKSTEDHISEWTDVVSLTIMPSVPTVFYKDNYFVPGRDFHSADALVGIVKNFQNCKFSTEKQILERIKSLTYNVQSAFGRTDQILRQIETKLNKEDEHKSTS